MVQITTEEEFPKDYFLDTLVRLLQAIKYRDSNYTREQRVDNLHYAYSKAAEHFAQPHVQQTLKADPKRLEASLRTIVGMVVYSWTKVSQELMADLSIHYTYTLILDDSTDDPFPQMLTFFDDFTQGKEQKHPWWKLVLAHFPNVLRHFGPFCGLNLIRSTVDFFEGCWIEQSNFNGYPGSHDFPLFLRRINGLGHCVGGSLWPKDQFDEQKLFLEITSAIAQMENWMVFVNDLISFYKEFDDSRDQTSLVNNYCKTHNLTLNQALEKLVQDTLHSSEQMVAVFADKDPQMMETIECFMHGYVTWHLCDKRYRISEVYDKVEGKNAVEQEFQRFYEQANKVGGIEGSEWAFPTVADLVSRGASDAVPDSIAAPSVQSELNGHTPAASTRELANGSALTNGSSLTNGSVANGHTTATETRELTNGSALTNGATNAATNGHAPVTATQELSDGFTTKRTGVDGLRIIIAGGAAGVGAACARRLARNGAKVIVADINEIQAMKTAASITADGGVATGLGFDFSQEASVIALMDKTAEAYGGIDGLINMGADLRPEVIGRDNNILDMDVEVWRRTNEVNLIGYTLTSKHVLPHIIKQGGGAILNISSVASWMREPTWPAYGASKAGVHVLTRHIASSFGPQNVRANSASFGIIATEPVKWAIENDKDYNEKFIQGSALKRAGELDEAAAVVEFLVSRDSSFVTGQVWGVNGGVMMRD